MAINEKHLDYYIKSLLDSSGIQADIQGSSNKKIKNALKTASKNHKGNPGRPEFCTVVNDFVIVIEDKADISKLEKLNKNGSLSSSIESTQNYAINGAVWYLKNIIEKTDYKRGFAIGAAGNENYHVIKPYFIDKSQEKPLDEIKTFKNFTPDNIDEYYRTMVLGEEPLPDKELKDILDEAEKLSEDLRVYTNLTEPEKSILVAAILLAIEESDFNINDLRGDNVSTDTKTILRKVEDKLTREKIPSEKREIMLNQFRTIFGKGKLDQKVKSLDETPIRYFTEQISEKVYPYIINNHNEDYLGRFYEVFLRYSKEGKKEGIILTPTHVTDLMVDLLDIKYDDKILDPCCGTGTFLVSAMNKMLKDAVNVEVNENEDKEEKINKEKSNIKENRIYGIEERSDLFAVASTNMILRGDGKSNIFCNDFYEFSDIDFSKNLKNITDDNQNLKNLEFTKGLMNPPYSQRKNEDTAEFSEIHFVLRLLNSIKRGGKAAVLVPLSAMMGNKNKTDKAIKAKILENHTLEGVITLQKDTFHTGQAGVQPCIAIFEVGRKHNLEEDIVKFINFEDDGYKVYKHSGLIETEEAKDKKQYLLDVWNGKIEGAPSDFVIKTKIKKDDEWLHSFYYMNEEIPDESSFEEAIIDYLTFEFSMVMQGKESLFKGQDTDEEH